MTGPEGGFYSALDADSEGVEGKFYVWTIDELHDVLGDDADVALPWFGASVRGNFEGKNILESRGAEPEPEVRERIRSALLAARAERVRPGLDDKRLTAWNALTISALAEAGAALERDDYLDAARRAAAFLLETMRDDDGRLLRTYNAGEAKLNAYLEDHAFLLEALIALYEATFEPRWFHAARATADAIIERFADPERGGFFQTSSDHEQLVARRKELEDNPIPSGASSAAFGLLRLAALTGEARYEEHAVGVLALAGELARRYPQGFGHLLQALDFQLATVREVALVGDDLAPLARVVRGAFRPHLVLAGGDGADAAASRCSRAARRSTAARPPTSARVSPASSPSPSRRSSRRCSRRPPDALEHPAHGLPLRRRRRPPRQVARRADLACRRRRSGRREPARQVRRRREERVDVVLAGRRRVDEGARGHHGPRGRRARAAGHRLSPRRRADRGRQARHRARPHDPQPQAAARRPRPSPGRCSREDERGRARGRAGQERRRGRHDHRSGRRGPRAHGDPRRRPRERRSPAAPATRRTRSRSSRASTARCSARRSRSSCCC